MKPEQLRNYLCIAGTVSVLVAQPVRSQVVEVRSVQLNPTDNGLEVILDTDGASPQVLTSSYKQTFVANIINTQLALPDGKTFRQDNPVEGITSVSVTQLGANSIRVTVIGKAGVPTAKVVTGDAKGGLRLRGLVVSVTAPDSDTTAQQPTSTPETPDSVEPTEPTAPATEPSPETEPAEPTAPAAEELEPQAEDEEEIEIVVTGEQETGYSVPNASTATRTDTPHPRHSRKMCLPPILTTQTSPFRWVSNVAKGLS